MASRHGACPGATPGNRTNPFTTYDLRLTICCALGALQRGRAPAVQPSFQNSAGVGQHHGGLPNRKSKIVNHKFFGGRGRQVMHLPCKQAYVGALPTDSTSLRCLHQRAAKAAAPKRSEAGLHELGGQRLRLGKPFFYCGKLDQSTENHEIHESHESENETDSVFCVRFVCLVYFVVQDILTARPMTRVFGVAFLPSRSLSTVGANQRVV